MNWSKCHKGRWKDQAEGDKVKKDKRTIIDIEEGLLQTMGPDNTKMFLEHKEQESVGNQVQRILLIMK